MKYFIINILSILLLTNTELFSANIIVEKQGNLTSLTNADDVVVYTDNQTDKQFIQNLRKSYNGLQDSQNLDKLLKEQNYIEVLNFLWTEPDSSKRLKWLESKVNENHPILMFELGKEYYLQNPSVHTYAFKSMPWILTGARRTLVDAACTSDESVTAAASFLINSYQEPLLEDLRVKMSQKEIENTILQTAKQWQKESLAILRKVMTPFTDDEAIKTMPAPNWVFSHGIASFVDGKNNIAEGDCNALRKKEAQEYLQKADELEKTLN